MILEQKNRWYLSKEKKAEITKFVLETIDKIASFEITEDSEETRYNIGTDLSELVGVGPYHIKDILEELGYQEDSFDDNGWQMDYWFHFQHPDSKKFPPLCLSGTAIIHEMYLRGEEKDYETYADREERIKNDSEFQGLLKQSVDLLTKAEELLKESTDGQTNI